METRRSEKKMATLSLKHYGNIKVYDPEGELIFIANNSRAKFYINNKLATIVEGDNNKPEAIKLNFKPKGKGHVGGSEFYLTPRKDECVICSTTEDLTRHHVVPYCYRKYMPDRWKSHDHHDILLLCINCHIETEKKYMDKKKEIIEKYGLSDYIDPFDKVIKAAYAIKNNSHSIPKDRLEYLKCTVNDYFGKNVTREDIEMICNTNSKSKKRTSRDFSNILINKVVNYGEFCKEWREFFVKECNPKNLPFGWKIDNDPPKLRKFRFQSIINKIITNIHDENIDINWIIDPIDRHWSRDIKTPIVGYSNHEMIFTWDVEFHKFELTINLETKYGELYLLFKELDKNNEDLIELDFSKMESWEFLIDLIKEL